MYPPSHVHTLSSGQPSCEIIWQTIEGTRRCDRSRYEAATPNCPLMRVAHYNVAITFDSHHRFLPTVLYHILHRLCILDSDAFEGIWTRFQNLHFLVTFSLLADPSIHF